MKYLTVEEVKSLSFDKYYELTQVLTAIDKSDIQNELSKSTTVFSYYHGLMIMQKKRVDLLNIKLLSLYSAIKNNELLSNKSKGVKLTATYLEDFVNSNNDYVAMKEEVLNQEEIYGYLKALCNALEHKKDMLVQLSANLRSETKLYN